jgi:hypothetical protein
MYENKMAIDQEEYRELAAKAERIETLKRLFASHEYISMAEVKAVLGITEDGEENGNV